SAGFFANSFAWASRIFLTISTARISAVCFTGYNLSRRTDRQGLIATFYSDGVKQPNLVEPDDVPEVPADQNVNICNRCECNMKNGATGGNHWLKSDGLSRRGHTGGIYRAHFQYAFLQQCCRLLIDRFLMNIRRVCILALFSALVAVLSVGNLMAQRIGFRVGMGPALRGPVATPGFGH